MVYKHAFVLFMWYRYRKAQLALQKGEEDLAREALKRRKSYAVHSQFVEYILLIFVWIFTWGFQKMSVSFCGVYISQTKFMIHTHICVCVYIYILYIYIYIHTYSFQMFDNTLSFSHSLIICPFLQAHVKAWLKQLPRVITYNVFWLAEVVGIFR